MNKTSMALAVLPLIAVLNAPANNLAVTNTAVRGIGSGKASVSFDVAWDNAWRDEVNYDAAWVFVKFTVDGGATWRHATLAAGGLNPPGFSAGAAPALDVYVPSDKKGAFLQRAAAGSGMVSNRATLVWDYAADGLTVSASPRIRVFGIEMVFIPEGPYYLGDDSSGKSFYVTHITTASMTATSATYGAGTIASPYENTTNGFGRPYGVVGTFNTNYPNGYRAFYMMKTEVSRQQYLDFVNSLPFNAATNMLPRYSGAVGWGQRNTAILGSHPNFTNASPLAAANFNQGEGWFQGYGYLDWAALRPMTEMEFEKACRGPCKPIDQDRPWGTAGQIYAASVTSNETPFESPVTTNANVSGTMCRAGSFARANSDQFQAGAGYYGVLDLAGNILERCAASGPGARTGAADSRILNYSGLHGDGEVSAAGTNNVPFWPDHNADAPQCARGGCVDQGAEYFRVADRYFAGVRNDYSYYPGCRGVRSY